MKLPETVVFHNLKGARGRMFQEFMAGTTVASIALPLALAFGVTAFGPLGPAYGALGAAAGLTGAAITGFFASLFGGCKPQISGPTGPMSMATRGAAAALLASPAIAALPAEQIPAAVILLFSLSAVLGGIVQLIMAWSRLGNLVRGIPYPVVAGFMNGVSVLIVLNQLLPAMGWMHRPDFNEFFLLPWPREHLPALISGLAAAGIMLLTPRLTRKIPAPLTALILGTAVYYIAAALLEPGLLDISGNSYLVGVIPGGFPVPGLLMNIRSWLPLAVQPGIAGIILQQGLVLGMLGIIDTLLTSVIADLKTGERHNSTRELFGQGIGNIVAGCFTALPGAGATVRTLANIDSGGRTGLSGMFHSLILLASLLVLGPFVRGIPLPVLAALMVVLGFRMVDYWSFELLKKRSAHSDSLVLWLVTAVTVAADLIVALGTGLILAAFLFVRRQTELGAELQSSDRRYLKSRVIRSETDEAVLADNGRDIRIVQLNGSLFFGSADDIIGRLEHQLRDARIAVLDIHGLMNLDLTGGRMLIDFIDRLQKSGSSLYIGGWSTASQAGRFLQELGMCDVLGAERLLPDGDIALEQAEAERLEGCGHCSDHILPEDLDFMAALASDERSELLALFRHRSLEPGEILYRAKEQGNEIAFILSGIIEISGSLYEDGISNHRAAAYGTGQHVGLTSWLEKREHSYTSSALGKVHLACLDGDKLRHLLEERPSLGMHLMQIWARQLAGRIRRSWEREIHNSMMADI